MDATGFWTGTYWYFRPAEPIVPFLANIDDHWGRITGTISEPDLHFGSETRIEAIVRGTREGNKVTFAKAYDGAGPMAHRVDYTGRLSEDGRTLEGSWYLAGEWGGFAMSRELLEDEEASEDRVAAELSLEEQHR